MQLESKGVLGLQDYLEIWGWAYTNFEAHVCYYGLLQILRCCRDRILKGRCMPYILARMISFSFGYRRSMFVVIYHIADPFWQ